MGWGTSLPKVPHVETLWTMLRSRWTPGIAAQTADIFGQRLEHADSKTRQDKAVSCVLQAIWYCPWQSGSVTTCMRCFSMLQARRTNHLQPATLIMNCPAEPNSVFADAKSSPSWASGCPLEVSCASGQRLLLRNLPTSVRVLTSFDLLNPTCTRCGFKLVEFSLW